MARCGGGAIGRLAIAVSGGADSMALALLAGEWCRGHGVDLVTLTVDHRLREDSAAEAAQVARWLAARGIACHVLRWDDGPSAAARAGSYETAARAARYRLLSQWCRAEGVGHVALAHQADDQAETFLMRLARGSGLDGLAAMAPVTHRDGLTLLRPLLAFSHERLVATCRALEQPWIDDPSNRDPRAQRVRFRQARAVLAREGLTPERLAATVAHLARAQAAIDREVARLIARACTWDGFGGATLSAPRLFKAAQEVQLRTLATLLTAVGGQDHGPRFDILTRALDDVRRHDRLRRTVHGCLMARAGDAVMLNREFGRVDAVEPLRPGAAADWDGRFRLEWHGATSVGADPLPVVALTDELWFAVRADIADPLVAGLAAAVRRALPAVRDDRGVVAVPHAEYRDARAAAAGWRFTVENLVPRAAAHRLDLSEIAPS